MEPVFILIGIGQSLRGDDAAGLEAVVAWQNRYPDRAADPRLRVELAEVPGLELLGLLEGSQAALLVDAVWSGAPPGTVHLLEEGQLAAFSQQAASIHGLGVAETLRLGRLLQPESLPSRLALVGIEAAHFKLGASLSLAVQAALPDAARTIQECLDGWLAEPDP